MKAWATFHFAIGIVLLGAMTGPGCSKQTSSPPVPQRNARESKPLSAEVVTLQSVRWPTIARSQGNLVADEVAVVGAKVAGRIASTHVDLGQPVAAGETLIQVDPLEFKMQLAQADAQLLQARSAVGLKPADPIEKLDPANAPPVREARAVYEEASSKRLRWEELKSQGIAADEEYDQVISAERVAEAKLASAFNGVNEKIALIRVRMAELDLAQDRLNECTILAPLAGIVLQRHVTAGTFVQVGDPLVTVVRIDPLRFQGTVPERIAQFLSVGQSLRLRVEGFEEWRTAKVTRISPTLETRSRALLFEATLSNTDQRIRAGLFAEAEIVIDPETEAIVVPASALVEFAGAEKVWKVVDGQASEQMVQTGRRTESQIEITQGLSLGDTILLDGSLGRVARVVPLNPANVSEATELRASALETTSTTLPIQEIGGGS